MVACGDEIDVVAADFLFASLKKRMGTHGYTRAPMKVPGGGGSIIPL